MPVYIELMKSNHLASRMVISLFEIYVLTGKNPSNRNYAERLYSVDIASPFTAPTVLVQEVEVSAKVLPSPELEEKIVWHGQFADPTLADAIPDRLVHNAEKVELKGESMRKTSTKTE